MSLNEIESSKRTFSLWAKYGITHEDYELMLDAQGHVCPICQRFLATPRHDERHWPVDHCHTSGAVRGILCFRCNTGLGQFQDKVKNLQRAIEYLCGERVTVDGF